MSPVPIGCRVSKAAKASGAPTRNARRTVFRFIDAASRSHARGAVGAAGVGVQERPQPRCAHPHLGSAVRRRQDEFMRPAVIAGAALLAGLAACALVLSSDHLADRAVWAVFGPVVGWSFVGTGLYASRRRPESRFGGLDDRCSASRGCWRRSAAADEPVAVRARDRARLAVGAGARARAAQLPVGAAGRRRPARRRGRRATCSCRSRPCPGCWSASPTCWRTATGRAPRTCC